MKRLLAVLLPVVTSVVVSGLPAEAQSDGGDCLTACTAVDAGGGPTLGVSHTKGKSAHVPGRGNGSNGYAPGRKEYKIVEEYLTPACWVNGLHGVDAMCTAAVVMCGNDGRIAFWVWHRTTHVVVGPPERRTVGQWDQEPGSYCLGADDPGVPTIARVISLVQTGFEEVDLPTFAVQTAPSPRTLVNVKTSFSAGSADPVVITQPILGTTVRITAKPLRWKWYFGDGTTLTTRTPGRPKTTDVHHVYRRTAVHTGVRVDVEWGGTFTVGSDPTVYDINGTAVVRGTDTTVDVRQARSELVSRR